ncbi:DUF5697 family protein [Thomasclavelia cocleata]|uniref:DUF5697 family protein n=1 Tax=Thomasclavelia cocleata TaxID=69824 RepID=UPI00256ED0D3|nr:DUF5697 family protein [Thomasclavelia cocleata]
MNDRLLKEEQLVIDCLSRYYCLKWKQLIKLLYYKDEEVAQRILVGLKKRQLILEDETTEDVTLDPRSQADRKTIDAFWVMLKFIKKINPKQHYKAEYPSEIFFLKENAQYEIVVLNKGEEHLINMLKGYNRNTSVEEDDEIRYIIVVQDEDQIEDCLRKTEGMKVLFASVDYGQEDVPEVNFYQV